MKVYITMIHENDGEDKDAPYRSFTDKVFFTEEEAKLYCDMMNKQKAEDDKLDDEHRYDRDTGDQDYWEWESHYVADRHNPFNRMMGMITEAME